MFTENQLEFQRIPYKRAAERKRIEMRVRFERLYQREQRLGIPIQRGTPLVLDVQHFRPVTQ
jgi:hypothetical protein